MSNRESADVNGITTIDGVEIHGMCGLSCIRYANILAATSSASIDNTQGARNWVNTPFTRARLLRLEITASPGNKNGSRSGRWGMVFLPFRSDKDEDKLRSDYRPVALATLQQFAGSVSGRADRPLSLVYRPKPEDGLVFQYNHMGTFFGAVLLAYSDTIRTNYHEFGADDCAPDVTIRGQIQLQTPSLGPSNYGFVDQTWTPNFPMMVSSYGDNLHLSFKQTSSFRCRRSSVVTGTCNVKGHALVRGFTL